MDEILTVVKSLQTQLDINNELVIKLQTQLDVNNNSVSMILNMLYDPWENIHTEKTEVLDNTTVTFLDVVSDFYKTPKSK